MKKVLGLQLVIYGVLLGGLGLVLPTMAPTLAKNLSLPSLAGGGLCLVWGALALLGKGRKAWSIVTLAPIAFILLSQAVMGWMEGGATEPGHFRACLLTTVMLVLTLALLIQIAHGAVQTHPSLPANAKAH